MRGAALLLLSAFLVCLAGPRAAADAAEAPAAWRDAAGLARMLSDACDAVEQVSGARFRRRPDVRISTQADVEQLLAAQTEGQRGMLETTPDRSRAFLAYYDPPRLEVHVLPDQIAAVAAALGAPELLDEDVLRVVLVHEATHALDFQRFAEQWVLACCSASDERLATEAALEGHAQLVAEEVARRWGIERAFETLTRLYSGAYAPPGTERGSPGFDQEAAFTYLQGAAFMRAVADAKGPEGVATALEDPPCETRVVDRPALWLDPALRDGEPDLQAVLEVFRPLSTRPGWAVSKWRMLGPAPALLGGETAPDGKPLVPYVDDHGLYAGSADGNRYLNVFLATWANEADAQRFADALLRIDRARDREPGWQTAARADGAGTEHALVGFTSWRRAATGGPDTEMAIQVARVGRNVMEVTAFGLPAAERPAQAKTVDLAARLLLAPPTTACAVALRAEVKDLLAAREDRDMDGARLILRDLLPSGQDLRRVVRRPYAGAFESGYDGLRLALRTTEVTNATVLAALRGVGKDARVRAWGATTEDLATGRGHASRFPDEMRAFARDVAAPGTQWIVLVTTPTEGGPETTWTCFVRLADRFLWIRDPWRVTGLPTISTTVSATSR